MPLPALGIEEEQSDTSAPLTTSLRLPAMLSGPERVLLAALSIKRPRRAVRRKVLNPLSQVGAYPAGLPCPKGYRIPVREIGSRCIGVGSKPQFGDHEHSRAIHIIPPFVQYANRGCVPEWNR